MRVGTNQSYASQISRMSDLQAQLDKLQNQISTGKRITAPSDDPLGANRVTELQRQIDSNQQYVRNMNAVSTQLSLADSAAETMANQLTRAKELALTAANGTMSATDRQNASTELGQIIQEMLALANTRDSAGNYIFSGSSVGTAAFAQDASGAIIWQGSGNPPSVQINDNVAIARSANGLSMLSIDGANGRQTIFQSLSDLKTALDNAPTTAAGQAAFQQSMSDALTNLDAGINRIVDQRATFGSRMSQVDSETQKMQSLETTLTTAQSNIESVDVAGAVVQLQNAQTLLQASQQSFTLIKKLSLFDYM